MEARYEGRQSLSLFPMDRMAVRAIRAEVSACGSRAFLIVQPDHGSQFTLEVDLAKAAWLEREAGNVVDAMTDRQSRTMDHGRPTLAALIASAPRPNVGRSYIQYDRTTETTRILFQYADRGPVAFRLTDWDVDRLNEKRDRLRALGLH